MKPEVAIVDYGMGNLRSVQKALEKAGARAVVTDSAAAIRRAKAVVLPGVGAFGEAVQRLRKAGLWKALQETLAEEKPFLGICLGLQLLFDRSEEDPGIRGFGYFQGSVIKFRPKGNRLKVPHMGWNQLARGGGLKVPCLQGVSPKDYFYFVHSYFPEPKDAAIVATRTRYGRPFCSSVAKKNLFASQFHPEKSGRQGLRILKNFVKEAQRCS